jgi:hypothetical protein
MKDFSIPPSDNDYFGDFLLIVGFFCAVLLLLLFLGVFGS